MLRSLTLRQRLCIIKTVAQLYYARFPLRQHGIHKLSQLLAYFEVADRIAQLILLRYNIHKRQAVSLAVILECIGQADVTRRLFPASEVHQYFIFAAAACIGGKADTFFGTVGIYALDESYRTDGYQVVHVLTLSVILLDDMADKPHVVLHKSISCINIAV